MENSGGIRASLAGRYATALFALAEDSKVIDSVGESLSVLGKTLNESADLRALIASPVLSRAESGRAIAAVASELQLDMLTNNMLGVLAANRRLDKLPAVLRAFATLSARHRGEVTAEVTSAHPLGADQLAKLKTALRQRVGSDVAVTTSVDPSLLGGLVVRLGSQMIDSSIKTRLNTLSAAMKG
ncbi:MAG: F0F1 ATP synthase subunit delta [Parasphingorhabdus sp.]|nr:F0F1 ATP synthase subunit delta [Parasphingorhabdus sp.]